MVEVAETIACTSEQADLSALEVTVLNGQVGDQVCADSSCLLEEEPLSQITEDNCRCLPPWQVCSSYERELYKPEIVPEMDGAQKDGASAIATTSTEGEREERGLCFYPPIAIQRYMAITSRVMESSSIYRKIIDVGCAGLRFLDRAKNECGHIQHLIGVDLDRTVLEEKKYLLQPMPGDYFDRRKQVLDIDVYHGSIFDYDSRLADADLITAIELIEHLQPEDIPKFEATIFGKLRPFCVIVTTPNVEFNAMFEMGDRPFRHSDHKFEWTRAEFKQWADGVVDRYPEYFVDAHEGIGAGPDEATAAYGFVSQMIVFRRFRDVKTLAWFHADRAQRRVAALDAPSLVYDTVLSTCFPSGLDYFERTGRIRRFVEEVCLDLERGGDESSFPRVRLEDGFTEVKVSDLMAIRQIERLAQEDLQFLIDAMTVDIPFSEDYGDYRFAMRDGELIFYFKAMRDDESMEDVEDFYDEEGAYSEGDQNNANDDPAGQITETTGTGRPDENWD